MPETPASETAETRAGAGRAAFGIGLSRLSGVVRAMLVTNVLGVGAVGDAFAAALRIPNMLQNLLGEGALSGAFVPAYARLVDNDREQAGRLAAAMASFLLAVTSAAVLVGVLAARPITRLIAWGFEGERFELAVKLVRITAVGAGVLVLGAWCVAVLNTHRRLFVSYVAPVIWNATQIATLVGVVLWGVAATSGATALAWAVTAGAVAQVMFSLAAVRRADGFIFGSGHGGGWGRLYWARLSWRQPAVRTVLRRLGPAVAGRAAFQISAFADLALASLLAVGATAALAAAQALYLLPVALIGVAVAAAELPAVSRLSSSAAVAERTAERLATTTFLVSGIVAIYLAAGVPLADTLFNLGGLRNAVGNDDVTLIAVILGAYALGLVAIVASRLCQNVLLAAGNTRTPAVIAVLRVSLSALVGVLLMFPLDRLLVLDGSIVGLTSIDFGSLSLLPDEVRLDQALPARLGAAGLALGASVGAWVELFLQRRAVLALWKRHDGPSRLGVTRFALVRNVVPAGAALAAGIVAAVTLGQLGELPAWVRLLVVAAVASGVHVAVGKALNLPAARQVISIPASLATRLKRGPERVQN